MYVNKARNKVQVLVIAYAKNLASKQFPMARDYLYIYIYMYVCIYVYIYIECVNSTLQCQYMLIF